MENRKLHERSRSALEANSRLLKAVTFRRIARQALKDDIHLRNDLNVCDGKITCKPVADAHGLGFTCAEAFLD